jgi:hypothetical protein
VSDSVQVAIGVVDGKVVAKWQQPVTEITFDPQNAYTVGTHLARAAMEAHQGKATGGEAAFIAGELATVKVKVTPEQRMAYVLNATHMIRSMIDQRRTPGQIAVEVVDKVLQETAR